VRQLRWGNGHWDFFQGHDWLMEMWEHYTPDELDEELGSSLMIMSFFSDRKLADAHYRETGKSRKLSQEKFATTMLEMFEAAMRSYAHLGRSIQTVLAGRGQAGSPYVEEEKIGRNDPCPCGSGKKYKKCCLQ